MSRRFLSAEDLKIWRHVTRTVQAYNPHPADDASSEDSLPAPKTRRASLVPAPPQARPAPPTRPLTVGDTAGIDRRTARRFKRGELAGSARIDLHGMTLEQAHAALNGFIARCHAQGVRSAVVITGGDPGRGRIRREIMVWLDAPRLRPLVLAVAEARHRDGGAGAFYVLLKRQRSVGESS